MKRMTKWAAVAASALLALAAIRTVALAHENAGKGDRIQHRVEKMKERLNLSDDQTRQLQQIFQEAHQQWQADQGKADKETMRARHEKMHEQIKSILTPEQWQKFEQMQKEHHGRGHWNHEKEKTSTNPSTPQS
jgi:Spy/CpxP family protein refolding chaperone